MGFIEDMQEKFDGPWPSMEEHLVNITRQYKEGRKTEASFHSQMALLYSTMHRVTECRHHAALVPDTAAEVDRINAWMSLARMCILEKDISGAIEYYQKCIDLDPEHEMALEELGWCLYEEKYFAEANTYFDRAAALEPEAYWLYEASGLAASQQEKYTIAIDYFTKAMENDEDHDKTDFYEYCIGVCYEKMKDFYRALAHYIKSLDVNPLYAESLNNMAALYFEHEGDIKTAMDYLLKAEKIAEKQEDSRLLQMIYINLVRLNSLIADYDKKEYYNAKLLEVLGFGNMLEGDDDDDGEEIED